MTQAEYELWDFYFNEDCDETVFEISKFKPKISFNVHRNLKKAKSKGISNQKHLQKERATRKCWFSYGKKLLLQNNKKN